MFKQNRWNPDVLAIMQRDWDERAKEDARYFVATLHDDWTDDEFFRSGEIWMQEQIGSQMGIVCEGKVQGEMRVLEIGCGAGRMTRALAGQFGRVDAVDISGEMISQARQALRDCSNVHFHKNNGADLSMFDAEEFDFVFSSIVFQHIPSKAVIENYILETWRVLRPKSVFRFQVQGASVDESTCDSWVGVGFTEADMEAIAKRNFFKILNTDGVGTQYYWLTFLKGQT